MATISSSSVRKSVSFGQQIKSRIRVTIHKYSIEIPKSVNDAQRLDEKNGNTLWRDELTKEITNVSVAFKILPKGESAPTGYKKASGHLVWILKWISLERYDG